MGADRHFSMTSREDVTGRGTILVGTTRSLEKSKSVPPRNPSVDDFRCENGQRESEFSFVKPADSRANYGGGENWVEKQHGLRAARRGAVSVGGSMGGLYEKICREVDELRNESGANGGKPPRRGTSGGRKALADSFARADFDGGKMFCDMEQRGTSQRKKPEPKYKKVERGYRDMENGVTWVVDDETWGMLGSMQGVATKRSEWGQDSTYGVDTCANCGDSGFETWLGCQTRTFDVSGESEQACSEEGDGASYRNLDSLENFVDILSDARPVASGGDSGAKNPEAYVDGFSGATRHNNSMAGGWGLRKEKVHDSENVELAHALTARVGVLKKNQLVERSLSCELCHFPTPKHKKLTVPSKKSSSFSEYFPKKVNTFLNQKSVLSRAGLAGFRGVVVSIFHLVVVSMIKRGK